MAKEEVRKMDIDHKSRFKERLAEVIQGDSNSSFARKCGVTETTIRKYLNGGAYPRASTLQKISQVTGRSISWLLGEELELKVRENQMPETIDGVQKDTELLVSLFQFLPIEQRSEVLKRVLKEVSLCLDNVERYNR